MTQHSSAEQTFSFDPAETPDARRLLALARDRSIAGREVLASSIAAIVNARAETFSPAEERLAGDILRTLMRDVERSVRAALAANLAASAAAPRDVILALAKDEIEVAFPVLAESPILTEDELIDIVRERATGHRIAVAMRSGLSEAVSGALLDTRDIEAVLCLLHNNDASIACSELVRLVDEAQTDSTYHEPLAGRPDLGRELALKLATAVAVVMQKRLIAAYDLDPVEVRNAAADAVVDAAEALAGGREDPSDALGARRRDVRQMIEILRRHEWPHFEAAMVRFTGLPNTLVHTILSERDGRRLTVLCRSAGVLKSDFASLFLLSRRAAPDIEVVDAEDVREALALFDSIDRASAARVIARWRGAGDNAARPRRSNAAH